MTQPAVGTSSDRGTGFTQAFSSFSVDDMQKAKTFYGETLGVKIKKPQEGLELEFEGGQSVFIYPKQDHQPATFTVLNFTVDDILASVRDLTAKGVKFESYDGDIKTDENGIMWGKRAGHGPNIAWFKDPAGNFLSVVEGE
ncbi:MAG: VOC family protein [Acidobacteriota bacterium]